MNNEGAHSVLPPALADRWGYCPASARIAHESRSNIYVTDAAAEGTLIHEVAAELVRGVMRGTTVWDGSRQMERAGKRDVAHVYYAAKYAAYCETLIQKYRVFGGNHVGVEQCVASRPIHAESFGTPDFFVYDAASNTLHIVDLKTGRVVVESDSYQLVNYATGVADQLKLKLPFTVHCTIVQPRASHVLGIIRTTTYTGSGLIDRTLHLQNMAKLAMGDDPPRQAGSWCRYCPDRVTCVALVCKTEHAYAAGMDARGELTGETLGAVLAEVERLTELLKYRLTGLQAEALERMRGGETVPGYTSRPGQGNSQWTIDADMLALLADGEGVDLSVPQKSISPAQALVRGLAKETVEQFTTRRQGALKLVKTDLRLARKLFEE